MLAVATLVGGALLFSFRPPSTAPRIATGIAPPRPAAALPALPPRFAGWPPFVLSWHVTGAADESAADLVSVLSSSIAWNPCGALQTSDCYVRFAWEDHARWSLTASEDLWFDDADPRELTLGALHYGVQDGVMIGVRESGRVPPFDACAALLRSAHAGTGVRIDHDESEGVEGWSTLAFSAGDEGFAHCLGPAGIPIAFTKPDQEWWWTSLERRLPTAREIGEHLVAGRAPLLAPRLCPPVYGATASSSPAGDWLLEVATGEAGLTAARAGAGIVVEVDTRPVLVGATVGDPSLLPTGARRREVAPGLVADEILEPAPLLAVPVEGLRLWLRFTEHAPVPRITLEDDADLLGEVGAALATAAATQPYTGPPPRGTPHWDMAPRGQECLR